MDHACRSVLEVKDGDQGGGTGKASASTSLADSVKKLLDGAKADMQQS